MEKDTSFHNPLAEGSRSNKPTDPCILVIFGVTGDLTARKLMPAIYNLALEGQLPANFACVGVARKENTQEQYRQKLREDVDKYSRASPIDERVWQSFSEKLFYRQFEFDNDKGYKQLKQTLEKFDRQFNTEGNRIFYLATQPSYFTNIIKKLHEHQLIYDPTQPLKKWSRVIIEKPFGNDYNSAIELQNEISQYLSEQQIYRIDHYLGKETVQNLLVFRFANSIFEAIWNRKYIDSVQMTVGENIGIGTRGRFWEETGLLRDMIQNHVSQLLSLVAMEPPVSLSADAIRDEKVKVLQAIRPIDIAYFDDYVVRGQYDKGYIQGESVSAYRNEENVDSNSSMETFVAMQLYIDNWRWANVPFFIRSGKRLPKRATEIAITFTEVPGILFQQRKKTNDPNVLVIRIQPNEGISLTINSKVPAFASSIQPVKMDFRYGSYFGLIPPEAYERLICDCISGDSTLFARNDEVINSWRLLTPILDHWKENKPVGFPNYQAGTWGPAAADEMIRKKGYTWRIL